MIENKKKMSDGLKDTLEASDILQKEIQASLEVGQTCLKQAKWIGLDGYISFCTQMILY
jgi:hypothetical protein